MKRISLLLLLVVLATGSVLAQNKVLSLDGNRDYVEVPNVTFSYEALTIEAWIMPRLSIEQGAYEIIGTPFDPFSESSAGIQLEIYGGGLLFDSINAPRSRLQASRDILLEGWHHISAVYDQAGSRIYVDGKMVASKEINHLDIDVIDAMFRIGCEVDAGSQFWNGALDEIRLWNVARTEAEIQSSMNLTLTGRENGLVGYWNFDDGTAKDLTANGNDGEFKGDAKTIDAPLSGVYIFDLGVRSILEIVLGKNEGGSITKEDLAGLKKLDAAGRGITNVSVLKHAISLTQLDLEGNQLTDISPLIENTSLSGSVNLKNNPLNNTALSTHIPALIERGIQVKYDIPEDVLLFKDANLEKAIRDALGIPTELLKKEDLAKLTELIVDGNVPWGSSLTEQEQIKDLVGLEHCVSLTQLNLRNHQLNDISVLGNLTKLSNIELSFNQLSDISPLSNLTNLSLWQNKISDINPLANLTSLTQLNLNHNNLSEVSLLSNLINLTYLSLYLNQITDISPLSKLTSLKKLELHENKLSDITPLIENTGISGDIDLRGNPLNNTAYTTHIPALEARGIAVEYDMPEGVVLFKDANLEKAIRDALGIPTELLKKEDLAGLKELSYENKEGAKIADLTGIEHCTNLTVLNLDHNQINDLSPLANLPNLTGLNLNNNQITDISGLANLTGLINLRLHNNELTDIIGVSWHDAVAYANWSGKRLPTEAEWEYAARGGSKGKLYVWGNLTPNGSQCNYADSTLKQVEKTNNLADVGVDDSYAYTAPVGSFAPNGYGLYDMAGNVYEWCSDWYGEDYYIISRQNNPQGPDISSLRVLRGGVGIVSQTSCVLLTDTTTLQRMLT